MEQTKILKIFALAQDPIYIGTGGYKLGRVDNTIVRDPTTRLPKIPGSSLAGVWRYYSTLKLFDYFKDEYKVDLKNRRNKPIYELFELPDNNIKKIYKTIEENISIEKMKELLKILFFYLASIDIVAVDKIKEMLEKILKELEENNYRIEEDENKIEIKKDGKILIFEIINKNEMIIKKEDNSELCKIKISSPDNIVVEVNDGKVNIYHPLLFEGNRYARIKCAGQDDASRKSLDEAKNEYTGHCGHCIICKSFGFSKKDFSWQGLIFFSDLNILFFPVFTVEGTKWITTERILKDAGILKDDVKIEFENGENKKVIKIESNNEIKSESEKSYEKNNDGNNNENYINLGWLYLPYEVKNLGLDLSNLKFNNFELRPEDIIIVPEDLFSHIVNSNLEVRTSVSIDPITGAAKEGALFTSEAIPRGTIFYGEIRIFDKKPFEEIKTKDGKSIKPLPTTNQMELMLKESKELFEVLGIGGMTTRGFGRLKIEFSNENGGQDGKQQ